MADASARSLAALRQSLALVGLARELSPMERVAFGAPSLDEPLGGGRARAAVHEIYAPAAADLAAAPGGAAARASSGSIRRRCCWCGRVTARACSGQERKRRAARRSARC